MGMDIFMSVVEPLSFQRRFESGTGVWKLNAVVKERVNEGPPF